MGFFTKEVEKELMSVLPNDKPVLMIRGKLESIKYTRGKKGVEPVLIVSQSKHKYSIHCKEGIPPKDINIGDEKNFYAVEDVRVNTEYISVMGETNSNTPTLPVSSSIDVTFNVEGGHKIQKTIKGNNSLFQLKRTKEKYLRLVGIALDERMM
jgi:hypothetical protein